MIHSQPFTSKLNKCQDNVYVRLKHKISELIKRKCQFKKKHKVSHARTCVQMRARARTYAHTLTFTHANEDILKISSHMNSYIQNLKGTLATQL